MVATVRLGCAGSIVLSRTLPTLTPATRTSASRPTCVASGKATLTWQPLGLSGIGPPKLSHRKSSSPKHDSAKSTIVAIRPSEGACFCIQLVPQILGSESAGSSVWLSGGFSLVIDLSTPQVPPRVTARNGPLASEVENSEAPLCCSHAIQKR